MARTLGVLACAAVWTVALTACGGDGGADGGPPDASVDQALEADLGPPEARQLIVPEIELVNLDVFGQGGEIRAMTLFRRGTGGERDFLAAIVNTRTDAALCGDSFFGVLEDAEGTVLADLNFTSNIVIGPGGGPVQNTGAVFGSAARFGGSPVEVTRCVLPGESGFLVSSFSGPIPGTAFDSFVRLQYSINGSSLTDFEPSSDYEVTDLEVVAAEGGQVVRGNVVNRSSLTGEQVGVVLFGVNGVGRPVAHGTVAAPRGLTLPPDRRWTFESEPIPGSLENLVAIPQIRFAE